MENTIKSRVQTMISNNLIHLAITDYEELSIVVIRLVDSMTINHDTATKKVAQYQNRDNREIVEVTYNKAVNSMLLPDEVAWCIAYYLHHSKGISLDITQSTAIHDPEDPTKFAEVKMVPRNMN